jgi:biopolymer transport protein ExbB
MANASIQKVEKNGESKGSNIFAGLAIVLCLVVGYLVWEFIMGDPSNFQDNNPAGHPIPGNYLAMVYK